jgi:hypothetical protein
MLIKRKDLLNLYVAIKNLKADAEYNKWFILLALNTEEKLKPIVNNILKISTPKYDYVEYENLREDIIKKYAEKDENNDFIFTDDYIKIDNKYKENVENEFKILDEQYKDVIEIRKKDLLDYKELLNSEIDINIEQIDFKYFPDNISKKQFNALKVLIKKDNNE